MPARQVVAKIQARRDGDAGFLQQAQGERMAVVGKAAAVGVEIERAVRGDGNLETQFAQRRQQKIPPCLKFPSSLLEDRPCFRRECQTAGVECRKDAGVIDEIPGAYKPIDEVMANQVDLVEVVHTLKQVVCVKG